MPLEIIGSRKGCADWADVDFIVVRFMSIFAVECPAQLAALIR